MTNTTKQSNHRPLPRLLQPRFWVPTLGVLAALGCAGRSSNDTEVSGATNWLRCNDVSECMGHTGATCSSEGYCLDASGERIPDDSDTFADNTSDDTPSATASADDGSTASFDNSTATEDDTTSEPDGTCLEEPTQRAACEGSNADLPRAMVCGVSASPPPVCVPAEPSPALGESVQLWCCPSIAGASDTDTQDADAAPLGGDAAASNGDDSAATAADSGVASVVCAELDVDACSLEPSCMVANGRPLSVTDMCYQQPVAVGCFDRLIECTAAETIGIDPDGGCWAFNDGCLPQGFVQVDGTECPEREWCIENEAECSDAEACTLVDECCQCLVLGSGQSYTACPPEACEQTLCETWNLSSDDVRCDAGQCSFDPVSLPRCVDSNLPDCSVQPECSEGTSPEADAEGCWSGRCVPNDLCSSGT